MPFEWTADTEHSWDTVKKLITDCVTLRLFDPNLPVIASTDASACGLGAAIAAGEGWF